MSLLELSSLGPAHLNLCVTANDGNSFNDNDGTATATNNQLLLASPPHVDEEGHPLSEYERLRLRNVQRNKTRLAHLGLLVPPGRALGQSSSSATKRRVNKKSKKDERSQRVTRSVIRKEGEELKEVLALSLRDQEISANKKPKTSERIRGSRVIDVEYAWSHRAVEQSSAETPAASSITASVQVVSRTAASCSDSLSPRKQPVFLPVKFQEVEENDMAFGIVGNTGKC